jgi:hypothetical protein
MDLSSFMLVGLLAGAPAPKYVPPPTAVLQDRNAQRGGPVDTRLLRLLVGGLTRDEVLEKVIARPEVAKLPAVRKQGNALDWVRSNLQAEIDLKRGTVSLRFRGGLAREQAAIVNAVATAYLVQAKQGYGGRLQRKIEEAERGILASRGSIAERTQRLAAGGLGPVERLQEQGTLDATRAALEAEKEALRSLSQELDRATRLTLLAPAKAPR